MRPCATASACTRSPSLAMVTIAPPVKIVSAVSAGATAAATAESAAAATDSKPAAAPPRRLKSRRDQAWPACANRLENKAGWQPQPHAIAALSGGLNVGRFGMGSPVKVQVNRRQMQAHGFLADPPVRPLAHRSRRVKLLSIQYLFAQYPRALDRFLAKNRVTETCVRIRRPAATGFKSPWPTRHLSAAQVACRHRPQAARAQPGWPPAPARLTRASTSGRSGC